MTNLQIPITTMTTQITDTGITISAFKDTTEQSINNLEQHVDELEEDIDFLDNQRQENQEAISELIDDINTLNAQMSNNITRIELLEKTIKDQDGIINFLFQKVNALEILLKSNS